MTATVGESRALREVQRHVVHAPRLTGRAQPALAGEGEQALVAAGLAFLAREAPSQTATLDEPSELAFHETGIPPTLLAAHRGLGQHGPQVLSHDLVQHRLFRLTRPIVRRQGRAGRADELLEVDEEHQRTGVRKAAKTVLKLAEKSGRK
jgi:hypothetical protein